MASPEQGKFLTGSLMWHVTVMSLSGAMGLTFTFLVDFLALWWISRRGIEAEMAAVGIAGTIQFAAISLGVGMMIGAVALVARTIGMGRPDEGRRIAATASVLSIAVQVALSVVIWVFRRPILVASGATGEVLDHAQLFLAITLPSMPLIAMGIMTSSLLRAVGDAWRSMMVTMAAGLLAVVLDPVLIVWMGWGVAGAGLSIVLARVAMILVGLWFTTRSHDLIARPRLADVRAYAAPYLAIALPAIATQMSTPVGNWILTREIAQFGEGAVAGWGVVMRLTILAFGGIFALSGAIGGIIGQNFGARRFDRVEGAYWAALRFCAVYTLASWAILASLSDPISASFHLSEDGAHIVDLFARWAVGAFIFTGALFVANASFNNLGRPLVSTLSNWLRDGVLMFPLALILSHWFNAPGIVWANSLANILAGSLAALLALAHIRRLQEPTPSDP